MDATQYSESDYVTAQMVKDAKNKIVQITGDAKIEPTDFGEKLELPIEIDNKKKKYRPNKDTIKNMMQSWSKETKSWIGKNLELHTMSINGKDSIIGVPKK